MGENKNDDQGYEHFGSHGLRVLTAQGKAVFLRLLDEMKISPGYIYIETPIKLDWNLAICHSARRNQYLVALGTGPSRHRSRE